MQIFIGYQNISKRFILKEYQDMSNCNQYAILIGYVQN